jgi:hypothetical protein
MPSTADIAKNKEGTGTVLKRNFIIIEEDWKVLVAEFQPAIVTRTKLI